MRFRLRFGLVRRRSADLDPLFGPGGEVRPQRGRASLPQHLGEHETWINAILPADAEAGSLETETNRRPLILVLAGLALLLGVLVFQLANLQLAQGQRNLELADGNRLRQKVVRAPRGIMYDRTGAALTRNTASFDVTITPRLLPRNDRDPAAGRVARTDLYARLSPMIAEPTELIAARAEGDCVASERAGNQKYTQEQAEAICLNRPQALLVKSSLEREAALNLDQRTADFPGVALDVNPIREYLDGGLLAATLGYTARISAEELPGRLDYQPTDLIGKLGLEQRYEGELRGRPGGEQTEVDAVGRPVKVLSSRPPQPGSNLVLSIDFDLQQKLAQEVQNGVNAAGATRGSAVAMNPKTGEVLALVNVPSYDNNLFAKGISQSDYSRLVNDPAQPLFNKVVGGAYPTGSIIKPFIAAAVLQEGTVSPSTTIEDKGELVVTNRYDESIKYTFRSYEAGGLGPVNLSRAIALSSNVYFFTVGGGFGNIAGLGVEKLTSYYNKFGLGKRTGIDVPGETAGRVPTPASKQKQSGEPWTLGDTYNISVGQGDIALSPLQMVTALSAIANRGPVATPHVVKRVTDGKGATIREVAPAPAQEAFISPGNLDTVRNAMRQVVNESYGTACCSIRDQVPVTVAGKTGTAETDPNGKRKAHAWFEAFAPYEDPQVAVVVLIENAGEGSQFAAPVAREFLKHCFTRAGGCLK